MKREPCHGYLTRPTSQLGNICDCTCPGLSGAQNISDDCLSFNIMKILRRRCFVHMHLLKLLPPLMHLSTLARVASTTPSRPLSPYLSPFPNSPFPSSPSSSWASKFTHETLISISCYTPCHHVTMSPHYVMSSRGRVTGRDRVVSRFLRH